jgi:protein-tyrosine phosphatase
MAEQVCRAWGERWIERHPDDHRLDGLIVESAGVSDEEEGNPIDPRASQTLREHGYPVGPHRARQITREMIESATLVIAAEPWHVQAMGRMAPQARNLFLITDYDPNAAPGSRLPDPYYGGIDGFETTLSSIEAAMPEILKALREA